MEQKTTVTATGEEVKLSQDGVEDLQALSMWSVPTYRAVLAALNEGYRGMIQASDLSIDA